MRWQLQAAKHAFDELVERAPEARASGRHRAWTDAVVVMSVEEYRRLAGDDASLLEFIGSAPDFDLLDLEPAGRTASPRKSPSP